jgi:hypothetical protein
VFYDIFIAGLVVRGVGSEFMWGGGKWGREVKGVGAAIRGGGEG